LNTTPIPTIEAPVTQNQLKAALKEVIEACNSKTNTPLYTTQTYASVAARQTRPNGDHAEIKRVIPERNTRELRIKIPAQPEDLAKRTPREVVEAVNKARGIAGAIAARRLRSGDVVVTFQETPATRENESWAQAAFGPTATIARPEYAVIAKGLPASQLRHRQHIDATMAEVQRMSPEIKRFKIELPRNPEGRYATVVLHLDTIEAAKSLCERGLVWEAQIFHCEPYSAEVRLQRCYRCHELGHIARYCNRTAKCGRCSGVAHTEGEQECTRIAQCVNCKGTHPAWSSDCPAAAIHRAKTQEAYRQRPRQFTVQPRVMPQRPSLLPLPIEYSQRGRREADSEGFVMVPAKRQKNYGREPARKGRPPTMSQPEGRASRDISLMMRGASSQRGPFEPPVSTQPQTQL
jgi:hypothetical protein